MQIELQCIHRFDEVRKLYLLTREGNCCPSDSLIQSDGQTFLSHLQLRCALTARMIFRTLNDQKAPQCAVAPASQSSNFWTIGLVLIDPRLVASGTRLVRLFRGRIRACIVQVRVWIGRLCLIADEISIAVGLFGVCAWLVCAVLRRRPAHAQRAGRFIFAVLRLRCRMLSTLGKKTMMRFLFGDVSMLWKVPQQRHCIAAN